MRSIFARISESRFIPRPGELIRSTHTPNYINIVIEVYQLEDKVAVRSVRYGCTNNGEFELLNGRRSRLIYIKKSTWRAGFESTWEIVEEYRPFNNSELRNRIVEDLKNVDTAWRPSENTTGAA